MNKKKKATKSIKRWCTIIRTMPTMIVGAASGTGDVDSTVCATSEFHDTDSFLWYNFLYYEGYTGTGRIRQSHEVEHHAQYRTAIQRGTSIAPEFAPVTTTSLWCVDTAPAKPQIKEKRTNRMVGRRSATVAALFRSVLRCDRAWCSACVTPWIMQLVRGCLRGF